MFLKGSVMLRRRDKCAVLTKTIRHFLQLQLYKTSRVYKSWGLRVSRGLRMSCTCIVTIGRNPPTRNPREGLMQYQKKERKKERKSYRFSQRPRGKKKTDIFHNFFELS